MATVNIPSTCNDPQYRYKMPRLVSKKEGRGNGSKTCIVNMGDVARALKRPPQYTTKWFGNELGAQSTYTCKEGEGERSIVNGHHDTQVFQTLLDKFIEKYVLCQNCHLPEIDMYIKKGNIQAKCMACGWAGDLDNAHRLAAFITKNPPDETGLNIINQAEAAAGKMDKKQRREMKLKAKEEKREKNSDDEGEDEEEEEDDDSDVPKKKKKKDKKEKKEKKDKKEKKEKKKKEKDDDDDDEDDEDDEDDDEKKEKKEKKEKWKVTKEKEKDSKENAKEKVKSSGGGGKDKDGLSVDQWNEVRKELGLKPLKK